MDYYECCRRCNVQLPSYGRYITFDPHVKPQVTETLCWDCYAKIRDARAQIIQQKLIETNYLVYHLSRARRLGLLADLTLEQWNETKEYFNHTCAYCQEPIDCLEHFIPLKLGGGTTKWNCVPACSKCNHKKRNLHPALVKLIPQEDIERVRVYLTKFL